MMNVKNYDTKNDTFTKFPHVARAVCVFALIKFPGKPYTKFNGKVTEREGARSWETFHV